jgi:hypothetical protein
MYSNRSLLYIYQPLDKLHAKAYDACMNTKGYITLRLRKDTHRQLKIVAALRQESMLETLAYLVAQEFERLQKGGKCHATHEKDPA